MLSHANPSICVFFNVSHQKIFCQYYQYWIKENNILSSDNNFCLNPNYQEYRILALFAMKGIEKINVLIYFIVKVFLKNSKVVKMVVLIKELPKIWKGSLLKEGNVDGERKLD